MKVWISHEAGCEFLGAVPAEVRVEVCADIADPPSDPAGVRFWVPSRAPETRESLAKLTDLSVIQLLSAGVDSWRGRVPDGVQLCDARGVHDAPVAEWVLGATIGALRGFPGYARAQSLEQWGGDVVTPRPELTGARVLILGAGSIGRAVEQRMAPFGVSITRVARTARPHEDVHGVDELPALLPEADVVVLLIPLTESTRQLVDGAFLAALPDGALLVNAARGPIVDTAALLTELGTGRIAAALDVTDPEPLPAGHPLWQMENAFITPHIGGAVRGFLPRAYGLAGTQLRRFVAGVPLLNRVVGDY